MDDEALSGAVYDVGFDGEEIVNGSMVGVSSSNLDAVGYDLSSMTLTVSFQSGSIYEYSAVPPRAFLDLLRAGSHGSHFHHNIRSHYSFQKVG
tara:strand:- start:347 stop:625 length:279 start_codon:yes stop_codon:yes gene_type:complete